MPWRVPPSQCCDYSLAKESKMKHLIQLVVLSLAVATVAQAQQAPVPPVRVRGTVQAFEGQILTLVTPKDGVVRLAVGPETGINGLAAKTLADIGDNTF